MEQRRRQAYFAEKLALSVLVLAGAPGFLALQGVPSHIEAALFALSCLQLAAAAIVRSGRLVFAYLVSVAGFVGTAAILAMAVHGGGFVALAWAALIAIDSMLLFDDRRLTWTGVGLAALVGIGGIVAIPVGMASATVAATMAVLAGVTLALIGLRVTRLFAEARRQGDDQQRFNKALVEAAAVEFGLFDRNGSLRRRLRLRYEPSDVLGEGEHDTFLKMLSIVDQTVFLRLLHDAALSSERCTATLTVPDAAGRPQSVAVQACAVDRTGEAGAIMVALQAGIGRSGHEPTIAPLSQAHTLAPLAPQRTDFLGNMSHELRTPLNAIIGFSEMLASQTIRPIEQSKQREYAGIIHQSGQHLLTVINELLDVSRLQAGTFALVREVFDAATTVDQCCAALAASAADGTVTLHQETAEPGLHVDGDRRALKQIVTNLLSNAVKFTPAGGRIDIAARRDGGVFVLTVADTGIGMNPVDLEQLGRPFFQVRSSLSRPYQGTGLGLSVVRGLVALHDGTLEVSSAPGRGTTMTVRLPLSQHEPTVMVERDDDRVVAYRTPDQRAAERGEAARHVPSPSPRMKQIA